MKTQEILGSMTSKITRIILRKTLQRIRVSKASRVDLESMCEKTREFLNQKIEFLNLNLTRVTIPLVLIS